MTPKPITIDEYANMLVTWCATNYGIKPLQHTPVREAFAAIYDNIRLFAENQQKQGIVRREDFENLVLLIVINLAMYANDTKKDLSLILDEALERLDERQKMIKKAKK